MGINSFIHDVENEEDVDLNYDITKELRLDDVQSDNDNDQKQEPIEYKTKNDKVRSYKVEKKEKQKNGYSQQNRIRYGPDGGFDTMGVRMSSKKKRRTKRKRKQQTKRVNLNDDSIENKDKGMSISTSQKTMSNWWKTDRKMKKTDNDRIKEQKTKDDRNKI